MIVLNVEEIGIFEHLRIRHNVDLGADVVGTDHWKWMKQAINEIVKTPVEGIGYNDDPPDMIGRPVLLCDRTLDEHCLRESAGAKAQLKLPGEGGDGITDPLYAAAIRVAKYPRRRVDDPSFLGAPAWYADALH